MAYLKNKDDLNKNLGITPKSDIIDIKDRNKQIKKNMRMTQIHYNKTNMVSSGRSPSDMDIVGYLKHQSKSQLSR